MNFKKNIVLPLGIALLLVFQSCVIRDTQRSPNGVWQSVGSGWLLEIQDGQHYALYDITSISCIPVRTGPISEINEAITVTEDTLCLKKGVITYRFVRAPGFPEICKLAKQDPLKYDALWNFEVFAETVKEHYAFMEINRINWDSLYAVQRSKLHAGSSETDVYQVIEETLEVLGDNHGNIIANESVYKALDNSARGADGMKENASNSEMEYGDFQLAHLVANHHLEEDMTTDSSMIRWGQFSEKVGYIQVMSMWLYAELDMSKEVIDQLGYVEAYARSMEGMEEGAYIRREVEGVSRIMDRVTNDLSGMEAMIIDLRFNGGGQDAVSFEILSRFIKGDHRVALEKLRNGNGFSPVLPIVVQGVLNGYGHPVYVLTSPQTASAAEAFALATIPFRHIRRIGSSTMGAMSTALEKKLPNGWSFTISNEIYMDLSGRSYENMGVPADLELCYPRDRQDFFRLIANDLKADKEAIEKAMAKLQAGKPHE